MKLENILKKSKNFFGASLLSAATLYSCQNPANIKSVKPNPETKVTVPVNPPNPVTPIPVPPKREQVYVHFENEIGIKTYAYGHHGRQRIQHENPNSYYNFNHRYPDQKENIELVFKDKNGNLLSQEKQQEAFNKIAGNYELKLVKDIEGTKERKDMGETIKGKIVQDKGKYFLRLPYFGTDNKTSTDEEAEAFISNNEYDLDENIIPNGIYDLIGEKIPSQTSRFSRSTNISSPGLEVHFYKDKFGVLDKDNSCLRAGNGYYRSNPQNDKGIGCSR